MPSFGPGLLKALVRRLRGSPARPARIGLSYAILLGEDAHNHVRRQQVQMLRDYGGNPAIDGPPHITLKQGFTAPALEPFERYFDALVADFEPFEITMRGYGAFDDGVIYLDVVPSRELDALRRRVVRDLSDRFGVVPNALEDDRYHFHATLAQGLPQASFELARQALRDAPVEFRFVGDTLALLYNTGTMWITYRRRTIGSPNR